jgi:hypothetical protein
MSVIGIVIAVVVGLILLFIASRIIKGCLPKILIALVVLGVIAFLAYRYFVK